MRKVLLYTSILLLTIIGMFIGCNAFSNEDKPFNQIVLSEDNMVINYTNVNYYDTVLSVGLNQAGVNGVLVRMESLSDAAKSNFDGELKAHIRYYNGVYYLFVDEFDREEAITVIAHEIIHILQYNSGQLQYDLATGYVVWENETIDPIQVSYDNRPWEQDAHQRDGQLSIKIRDILYN